MARSGKLVDHKIMEEATELTCAHGSVNLAAEAADVIFWTILKLAMHSVPIIDVLNELTLRKFRVNQRKPIVRKDRKLRIGFFAGNHADGIAGCFEKIGINIQKVGDDRSLHYIAEWSNPIQGAPDVVVIPCKPKDVAGFLEKGLIDAALCFADRVRGSSDVQAVCQFRGKDTNICLVGNRDFNIAEAQTSDRKLTIAAEYVELASEWAEKNGIDAKIEKVSGSAESYVINGIFDLCVVVVDTGKTLVSNDLIIVDTILHNELALYIPSRNQELRKYFVLN
jgi:ATP phosphoribosyltransferase